MSSTEEISKILHDNLFMVFDEADHEKRLAALGQLWVADPGCLFVDPMGAFRTHNDISTLVGKLKEQNEGKEFKVRSKCFLKCSSLVLR
jgi:hypothetical protein